MTLSLNKRSVAFLSVGMILVLFLILPEKRLFKAAAHLTDEARTFMEISLYHNYSASVAYDRQPKHYYLLSDDEFIEFYKNGISWRLAVSATGNALFNVLAQPVFPCVFTPQVFLNVVLLPFFIYGAVLNFKKVPIMIICCLVLAVYVGLRDSIIESLIRHRMPCELIYLSIGLAGFTRWITRNS